MKGGGRGRVRVGERGTGRKNKCLRARNKVCTCTCNIETSQYVALREVGEREEREKGRGVRERRTDGVRGQKQVRERERGRIEIKNSRE